MKPDGQTRIQTAWLSDHPVLEFLNTTSMVDGRHEEQLQTDADVLHMLHRLGWPTRCGSRQFKGALIAAARSLREEVRHLIEARKAGKPLKLARLSTMLREARSHVELSDDQDVSLTVDRVWECATPQQALAPVAEAAADLLASGDFRLIRRCEGETCVLWFYDRTKSHQRRWCSMASCGNRHKVSAYRKRLGDV